MDNVIYLPGCNPTDRAMVTAQRSAIFMMVFQRLSERDQEVMTQVMKTIALANKLSDRPDHV